MKVGHDWAGYLLSKLNCEDLKAFFEVLPDILEAEHGRFSFWNGLGATSKSFVNSLQ